MSKKAASTCTPVQSVDGVATATLSAIESITKAIESTQMLALLRSESKLSTSRVTSVTKELKELRKVLVFYTATC